MSGALPGGTVTFLFTDVEGSTRLLHELGEERYAAALSDHRRALRRAFAAQGGVEVDTHGDAFFFAFPTAPGALDAARDGHAALAGGPIRVRIGLHTGTPLLTDEGYVGADVHRAARIAAAAHGGQTVVSASTAALADGVTLVDLGDHRFKDLAAAERVYQLGAGEFPPLESLYRTNLPVPATPFLGRDAELAAVVELLRREDVRLVSLTGPGGTGKTRLALQAAAETADRFPDGVTCVSLSPLRDPALALPTIAQALGVQEQADRPLASTLGAALAGQSALVLLDNAEHLLPELAADVATLRDSDGPTTLVTTRERLQLAGEQLYAVPALSGSDSAMLFRERATALGSTPPGNGSVDRLCERLDHLPLAVELAAARTVLFTPEQLLERLGGRLDLLKGGRDADPRQQTLLATIAWSYDLLDEEEQRVFRGLSVFAGGCTLEAAEAILDADPDTLQSLLDKSVVRRRDEEGGPRYGMLETIREFAAEQLIAAGERDRLAQHHAAHFSALSSDLAAAARRSDSGALDTLNTDHDNLRVAFDYAVAHHDSSLGEALVVGLWHFWLIKGFAREGYGRVEELLAVVQRPSSELCALAGELARFTGHFGRAVELKEQAIATRPADDPWLAADVTDLAETLVALGDLDRAEQVAQRGLELRAALGDELGIAHARDALVRLELRRGNALQAAELAETSIDAWRRSGLRSDLAHALWLAAIARRRCGDLDRSVDHAREALVVARDIPDWSIAAAAVDEVAAILAIRGHLRPAARLYGAASAWRLQSGFMSAAAHGLAPDLHELAAGLPEEERRRLIAEGGLDPIEAAVSQALDYLD